MVSSSGHTIYLVKWTVEPLREASEEKSLSFLPSLHPALGEIVRVAGLSFSLGMDAWLTYTRGGLLDGAA